ncbi:MAG: hypothetical protein ACFFD9_00275 [Candidatus Thorarchaeota archaeon]
MRREKTTVLLALLLAFGMSAIVFVVPSVASVSAELPDYEPMDVGPRLRDADYPIQPDNGPIVNGNGGDGDDAVEYDRKEWLSLDDYYGYYFFTNFSLRAFSATTEIWVQVYEERGFPAGDPRGTPVITQAEVEYLLAEFDSHIYPTVSGYFGNPDFHDGTWSLLEYWGLFPPGYYFNEDGRNVILVSNFGDETFYDPTYPYYIAGFFSSSLEGYHDRNIISIDTWAWEDRIGPEGTEWLPGEYVDRPFTYEAIIAHEEQHLIHSDYHSGDPSFINEGCSMYAEVLAGYGIPWGDINSYLATPDNSLTEWGDQGGINILADYGAAALFAIYLIDQFGFDYWSNYMAQPVNGIPGLETGFGRMTFDKVFHNWRIANLIHSDRPGHGRYNYKTLDLAEAEPVRTYPLEGPYIPWTSGSSFGTTITILGYDTGVSLLSPYSTDYIELTEMKKPRAKLFLFDGDDSGYIDPGPQWTYDGGLWYSGQYDLMNTVIAGVANVDAGDPTLVMTTFWDIESWWDFGFVQVSTDDGMTWTSLENEFTTSVHDPAAHPNVVANLPGLTGSSGDFIQIEFDLSAYTGEVLIGFRYVTDWAFTEEGWIIDDSVTVSGMPLELAAWFPPPPEADFMVTIVSVKEKRGRLNYYVKNIRTWDEFEFGMSFLWWGKPDTIFVIVSPIHDAGVVDYEFAIMPFRLRWCSC